MAIEIIRNEKILYYLGAGASAKALPLARTVWEEISEKRPLQPEITDLTLKVKIKGLALELEQFLDDGYPVSNHNIKTWGKVQKIKKDCKELATKANEFGDVDTYAKYLQIMDPKGEKLNKLKKLVSIYFSLKQIKDKALDKRYVPWMVGIMKEKQFPENIKILNWNYDSQIQIAAKKFGDNEESSFDSNESAYNPALFSCYPDLEMTGGISRNFSLIHLNGRAGLTDMNSAYKDFVFRNSYFNDIDAAIEFLIKNNIEKSLHFAWENSMYHKDLMKDVFKMIEDVTIMVVIGYSFPFFNREVDKEVFRQLKANKKFYKIYYQDPVLDGQQLKAQFELDKDFPIVHINQTDNFHIPFEY